MIKKRLFILLTGAVACYPALAQTPVDKPPLTESDLLRQIETLNPLKGGATPSPAGLGAPTTALLVPPRFTNDLLKPTLDKPGAPGAPSASGASATSATHISPGTPGTPDPTDKKTKGPTEITALEATFDQRANVAVFIGSVVVKDPEFNVVCDKLTAYLKHDKGAPAKGAVGATPKPGTPGSATPKAATPKPVTPNPTGGTPVPGSGTPAPGSATAASGTAVPPKKGGLDHAIAITTSERRVIITQDKLEADGTITHGIGLADRADYDANTGDIVLTGMPDVTQNTNRCIATDPKTWMRLNRDGKMDAHGPHRTIIVDTGDRDANKDGAANPNAAKPAAAQTEPVNRPGSSRPLPQ